MGLLAPADIDPANWGDILTFSVAVGSLAVSAYIAYLLHRLTRRFSEHEAMRSINQGWDSFHRAMLDKEVHDLFWQWVSGDSTFNGLGDRAHHIVLMYLNGLHTEYYTWRSEIFADGDVEYLDTLLHVFQRKRADVIQLAEASGYDRRFLCFLRERLPPVVDMAVLPAEASG